MIPCWAALDSDVHSRIRAVGNSRRQLVVDTIERSSDGPETSSQPPLVTIRWVRSHYNRWGQDEISSR